MEKENGEFKNENQEIVKINDIYNKVNKNYKCNELFTEGFSSEQIYYQIEGLCEKVIKENGSKVEIMYQKFLTIQEETIERIQKEESTSEIFEEECASEEEEIIEEENEDYDYSNSKDFDSNDSEAFERYRKALEEEEPDISEEDEDTFSDEGSIEDPEELKDLPAAELFKKLDKDIKKKY